MKRTRIISLMTTFAMLFSLTPIFNITVGAEAKPKISLVYMVPDATATSGVKFKEVAKPNQSNMKAGDKFYVGVKMENFRSFKDASEGLYSIQHAILFDKTVFVPEPTLLEEQGISFDNWQSVSAKDFFSEAIINRINVDGTYWPSNDKIGDEAYYGFSISAAMQKNPTSGNEQNIDNATMLGCHSDYNDATKSPKWNEDNFYIQIYEFGVLKVPTESKNYMDLARTNDNLTISFGVGGGTSSLLYDYPSEPERDMKTVVELDTSAIDLFDSTVSISDTDDSLRFTTDERLEGADVNSPYTAYVEAAGGDGNYTFTLDNVGSLPPGISFSTEDNKAKLSGTPTYGGMAYGSIGITVTDGEGNIARRTFKVSIAAKAVTFKIGQNIFPFNDLPQTALDIVPYVDGADASSYINFTTTYAGEPSQTNAGKYKIKITVTNPGYMYWSKDKSQLIINKNTNVNISFENLSFEYTGTPRTPTETVQGKPNDTTGWVNLSHTVYYEGVDTTYDSPTPPTLPGIYRMLCTVTDNNYVTPANNSTQFEIRHKTVNFYLDDTSDFYQGETWSRNYLSDDSSVTGYTVSYVQNGTKYPAPVSGTYTVSIELKESDKELYEIGTITPPTITVKRRTASFTITNKSKPFNDTEQEADVSSDNGLVRDTDYKVTYYNSDNDVVSPKYAGTYTFVVEPLPGCAYDMTPITDTFEITPVTIDFAVTENFRWKNIDYTPTVATTPSIPASCYDVTYLHEDDSADESKATSVVHKAGEYDVIIKFKSEYVGSYLVSDASTKKVNVLIVAAPVDFVVTGATHEFDGSTHEIESITATCEGEPFTAYTFNYVSDKDGTEYEPGPYAPINVGSYVIHIIFDDPTEYAVGEMNYKKLVINPQKVKFLADKTVFDYTGLDIDPEIYTDPEDSPVAYSVTCVRRNAPEGTINTKFLRDVGTYDIVITISDEDKDNYIVDIANSVKAMTVNPEPVDFEIEQPAEFTYGDGQAHTVNVSVTSSDIVGYEVLYKKGAITISDDNGPTDAGTYTVVIQITDDSHVKGTVTPSDAVLTVHPKSVNFSLSENKFTYDGAIKEIKVVPDDEEFDEADFIVKYKLQGSGGAGVDYPMDAGVYDVDITINNSNYVLDSGFSETVTIDPLLSMPYGNSPAGMIYQDVSHAENAFWRMTALNYLKANKHFDQSSELNVPNGCNSSIVYTSINGEDPDLNEYTIIVSDINDFTDPGMLVEGGSTSQTISGTLSSTSTEGLYKLTYTYDETTMERYVIELNTRIGDANGDGWVNAVDANVYKKLSSQAANTIVKARAWDVNKDGKVNMDDAMAIRKRLSTPLTSYYPWITGLN